MRKRQPMRWSANGAHLPLQYLVYDCAPIDDADVQGHQQVADRYLTAGVIRQAVDIRQAFDRSVFSEH
jgi:hypothetical protein